MITALCDPDGRLRGFAEVTRDITARRLAEERAEQLRAEREARLSAEAANRARSEFLAMTAHELRTPLTALRTYASLLLRRHDAGVPIERHLLVRLGAQTDRFATLVEDVGETACLETNRPLALAVADIDLRAVVREAAAFQVQSMAERADRRHEVALEADDGPFPLRADAGRLEQVLANLIDNAIKYSPAGGGPSGCASRGRAASTSSPCATPAWASPRRISRRSPSATFARGTFLMRNFAGLGLGLAICREIVERHGGRLSIESALGKGTEVRVHFPEPKYGECPGVRPLALLQRPLLPWRHDLSTDPRRG